MRSDEGSNRILAVGNRRMLDELGTLIDSLDIPHPQVLIEAMVVVLSDSEARDLAVELSKIGDAGRYVGRLSSLFGIGVPDPSSGDFPPLGGTGFEGVLLDPGNFSAVVRALSTLNEGRTLTVPKVLVNNNETATLDSVLQTPFTSINAGDTVATTSFGGTLDAGTSIEVTPQITEGDRLLLEYKVSLSSFVGEAAAPTLPPPRQENSLSSRVTIPDGYAVVVGGLEMEMEAEASSRVPVLGSLPLIGGLFRNRSRSNSHSRFYVFVRASVLRSPRFEELRHLSARAAEDTGLEIGWPTPRPRVIR